MTSIRDVYLLAAYQKPSPRNVHDTMTGYKVVDTINFAKVNNTGPQLQKSLFAGDVYSDVKTVVVPGHPNADRLAFADEYDPDTEAGVVYSVTLIRKHSNVTAFFAVNTKATLLKGGV